MTWVIPSVENPPESSGKLFRPMRNVGSGNSPATIARSSSADACASSASRPGSAASARSSASARESGGWPWALAGRPAAKPTSNIAIRQRPAPWPPLTTNLFRGSGPPFCNNIKTISFVSHRQQPVSREGIAISDRRSKRRSGERTGWAADFGCYASRSFWPAGVPGHRKSRGEPRSAHHSASPWVRA